MSKLYITSDLHLGHSNITRYRTNFATAEEHHETLFENLATTVGKRDTLYLLGDVAFDKEWLARIASLKVRHKVLICGNHDLERGIHMRDLVETYDAVYSLWSKRDYWFSHCPIHPQEMRARKGNIHGHLHGNRVWSQHEEYGSDGYDEIDTRYLNACVEHCDWKPITFQELTQE
jgi:calcineurin-like phosphoesterase family protein